MTDFEPPAPVFAVSTPFLPNHSGNTETRWHFAPLAPEVAATVNAGRRFVEFDGGRILEVISCANDGDSVVVEVDNWAVQERAENPDASLQLLLFPDTAQFTNTLDEPQVISRLAFGVDLSAGEVHNGGL